MSEPRRLVALVSGLASFSVVSLATTACTSPSTQPVARVPQAPVPDAPPAWKAACVTPVFTVLFGFGDAVLDDEALRRLARLDEFLRDDRIRFESLIVYGYVDALEDERLDPDLSTRRAAVVERYLVGQGVAPSLITVRAMRTGEPAVASGDPDARDAAGRRKRRVEIEVVHRVRRPPPRADGLPSPQC